MIINGEGSVPVTNEVTQPLRTVLVQFKAEREWH